jgi:hypothetical protein
MAKFFLPAQRIPSKRERGPHDKSGSLDRAGGGRMPARAWTAVRRILY